MNRYRLFIYPKDVTIITGKGLRHAQKLLRDIHAALGKKEHQQVSIEDFAHYQGLDVEAVREACMGRTTKDR
ncbi:hypothetical protein GCM10023231_18550 [Olivibacter ginsenosidimutans]|uniref:Uncharacterized protein n=1 Tax=Olivibacter ginsenosidimutans TaxID=1176537 RepID=A0ABP9B965_9SPHI